jgi:hypothetical protein
MSATKGSRDSMEIGVASALAIFSLAEIFFILYLT